MDFKTNFINFVMNEGIMPSVLTRAIRSDAALAQDYEFIASVLDCRCAFEPDASHQNDNIDSIVAHLRNQIFESDPELTKWLADVSVLLQLIKQEYIYSDVEIPTQQKQWAVSAFIKSCPLLPDMVKQQYLASRPESDDVVSYRKLYTAAANKFASAVDANNTQTEFVNYMIRHEGKAPVTANAYKSALNSIKKKYGVDFLSMTDISQIDGAINRLMDSDDFMDNNASTHGAWVAAMRKYRAFRWFKQYVSTPTE